ncbi:Acetyltransferase (GNAT) domain-containing protein [Abditibacterium utsteinense]|uniref:Acetyltransferase (GNAT) domain-containing protein n=1 Tax=Abditibacterium utsteinense TaxID=1960156 RepID=A0A2S8SUE0_9BACT|nr:GNAT family N-acetyltransferase [Abditibacterium utsteinense]PQV64369.1 Acetyltransferase (GNAT) domain-containing protein [Abditibacterium utsteinense]
MTVFQTQQYRESYAQVFGRGKRFHSVDVPGAQVWLQSRGIGAKRLEFWGQGIADCGGALIETPEAAPALWQEIERLAQNGQGTHLTQIEATSPLIFCGNEAGWTVSDAETCPVLTFPDTFDEYVKSLGKNMREQIKRYPKRLEKQFKVEYELAQTEAQLEVALSDLFRLHGKRWRARGQTGVLGLPSRQKFHRLVCQKFLEADFLRLWTLRCDGQAACVLLSYFWGGRYWFFIGGFEPDLMRWSVGTCLFARVFQHAIEEGASEFDFLRGAEEYKYRFGAVNRDYKTLSHFSPTPRGHLLRRRVALENAFIARLHEKFGAN